MRILITTLVLMACTTLGAQTFVEDSVLIEIKNDKPLFELDYSPAETWEYFLIPDTLQLTVLRSQPALAVCGSFNFAEIIYGTDAAGERVRIIVPCGAIDERDPGSTIRFVQARPVGRVSDHEFRTTDAVAREYATGVLRTAWGQIVD